MSKIKVLPDSLANKIAAGEVVERPASIVKELIENSIDAGARAIEVAIESGGRKLIRVSDDGDGMMRDDAILAFERHATSKITKAEDLDAIMTLGFRGEALASIASVAKVRLRTQTSDAIAGTEIEISGGRMLHVKDVSFDRGAEFEIRDLFFNVPARRKFLKSEATENFHIANLVTHYALANHKLSFVLLNNKRESIRVTPASDLKERAYQLFGGDLIGDLIEVYSEMNSMRVSGFVSSPSNTRTSKDSQFFFINGRYVRDKVIASALSEGYRAMIPSGVYPTAMLFIELPPNDVDVNVHPAKTEVRFVRSAIVHDLIRDGIRNAIGKSKAAVTPFSTPSYDIADMLKDKQSHTSKNEAGGAFNLQAPVIPPPAPKQEKINLTYHVNAPGNTTGSTIEQNRQFDSIESPTLPDSNNIEYPDLQSLPEYAHEATVGSTSVFTTSVIESNQYPNRLGCLGGKGGELVGSNLKPAQNITLVEDEINILGQLHNSFIIAADRVGLLLIDQHVAHERILFEQHWRSLRDKNIEVQRLLIPDTLDLTPAQATAFDHILPQLEENGFEADKLSGRTIVIKAMPSMLGPGGAQSLLMELLDAASNERNSSTLDEIKAEIAASLACRAAVKINMQLAQQKMQWMITELLKMANPATCPHGRPIILRITMRDIEKGFQR